MPWSTCTCSYVHVVMAGVIAGGSVGNKTQSMEGVCCTRIMVLGEHVQ